MQENASRSYDKEHEIGRLKYLLGRRELELEQIKSEIEGEHEVNSICAAYLMYLMLESGKNDGDDIVCEIDKSELFKHIGRYFTYCENTGDAYKLTFIERKDELEKES